MESHRLQGSHYFPEGRNAGGKALRVRPVNIGEGRHRKVLFMESAAIPGKQKMARVGLLSSPVAVSSD